MPRRATEVRRRDLRRPVRGLVAAGLVLVIVGLALDPGDRLPAIVGHATAAGGGGGGGGGESLTNVTINLTDAPSFDPASIVLHPPAALNLTLINLGAETHTFTLVNRPNFVLNRSWTPAELDGFFHTNGSQANVSLAPGNNTSVTLHFTSSQSGFSYEFVSVVAYQFQAGMLGFLNLTGAPAGPGLLANVSAAATQLVWVPDTIGVSTASFPVAIDMAITNVGSSAHTFWIAGQANYTLNPGNFSKYFVDHPPLAALNVPTQPGVTAWANFTILKPGVYEYICTIPGHFTGGMYGFLYVGVPLPSPPVLPSTAIVSAWILYVGGGLLGIGGLLAGSALLVGRFPRTPGGGHGPG